MYKHITVRKSIPNDVYGIREVQRITWINTYPNIKEGITISDITNIFINDNTPKGRQQIEERKGRYNNHEIQTWVAEENNKIVGYCVAGNEHGKDKILAIYVLPEYQGKGIGSELITESLQWMGSGKTVYIHVVAYNTNAISFYNKHGFKETGVRGVFDSAAMLPSGKSLTEIELVREL